MRWLILFLLAWTAPAADLVLAPTTPWFRPDAFCLVDIRWPDQQADEAQRLSIILEQGDVVLAHLDLALDDGASLRSGVACPLFTDGGDPQRSARLLAAAYDDRNRLLASSTATLAGDPVNAAELDHLREIAERDEDLTTLLWLREIDEHHRAGDAVRHFDAIARRLSWIESHRANSAAPLVAGSSLQLAFRDTIDGSIYPARLHLPLELSEDMPLVLACPSTEPCDQLIDRTPLALPRVAAARHAGAAVLVPFSGGDGWRGRNIDRLARAVAAAEARVPALDSERIALLGIGNGARAAIGFAERWPDRSGALALIDARLGRGDASASIATNPDVQTWLATWQEVGTRPVHLAHLDCGLIGETDQAARSWTEAFRLAGGVVAGHLPGAEDPTLWRWLLTELVDDAERQVQERIVARPGQHGLILVESLTDWPSIARLHRQADGSWTGAGIRSARSIEPHAQPWRGAQADPPQGPAKIAGRVTGPLAAYADAPFVIVVGTGESVAAAADNRATADAFVTAWRRHTTGTPAMIDDHQFDANDRRNLVCIGSPRSNSVLADLVAAGWRIPVTWDDRFAYYPGGDFPRQLPHGVAAIAPHPRDPTRAVVLLEGQLPPGPWPGVPLSGLPDLTVTFGADQRFLARILADWRWQWPER